MGFPAIALRSLKISPISAISGKVWRLFLPVLFDYHGRKSFFCAKLCSSFCHSERSEESAVDFHPLSRAVGPKEQLTNLPTSACSWGIPVTAGTLRTCHSEQGRVTKERGRTEESRGSQPNHAAVRRFSEDVLFQAFFLLSVLRVLRLSVACPRGEPEGRSRRMSSVVLIFSFFVLRANFLRPFSRSFLYSPDFLSVLRFWCWVCFYSQSISLCKLRVSVPPWSYLLLVAACCAVVKPLFLVFSALPTYQLLPALGGSR